MKKVSLLALAGLLSLGSAFADGEFYVIKDGQLANGAKAVPTEGGEAITFGAKASDGSAAAAFQHNVQWTDYQIDLSAKKVDLTKAWYLVIEYMLPTEVGSEKGDLYQSLYEGKNPVFHIGLFSYGKTHYTAYGILDPKNPGVLGFRAPGLDVNKADSRIRIDAKHNMKANEWIKESRLCYANAKGLLIDTMLIGCVRECADANEEPVYIKNLYFTPTEWNCGRPFYTEDFQGFTNGWEDGELSQYPADAMSGGYAIEGEANTVRNWEDGGFGKEGNPDSKYLDCEMLNALYVNNPSQATIIKNIAIPANHNGKLAVSALFNFKWYEGCDEFYDADQTFSFTATTDNGETIKLFDGKPIPTEWTAYEDEVTIPSDAKTVTLTIKADKWGFLVDNLMLGTCLAGVEVNEAAAAADAVIYVANDQVVVEGIEYTNIEVVNMNGAVVANENISALAQGSYVAKVYTAEGVKSQVIIKK